MTAKPVGPLNRAPYFPSLTPGQRAGEILVTDDGRVLLLRPDDKNYLLFPTDNGEVWYEFRTEKVTKFGTDYPVQRIADRDWNHVRELFPDTEPEIGECWEVDFGHYTGASAGHPFKMTYRSESLAREAAARHKASFGGIGGEYEPMGWYPVRELSEQESAVLFG